MENIFTGNDPQASTTYSDSDVTQWILRVWRESARQSAQSSTPHIPSTSSNHHNDPLTLQLTAVRLFGDKVTLPSSTSCGTHTSQYCLRITDPTVLKRRYRQIALRIHPDKNTSTYASEAFQLVQNCFEHAMSAGSSATQWAWCPPQVKRPEEVKHYNTTSCDDTGRDGNVTSVSSSLFTSSTSSKSNTPSTLSSSTSSSSHSGRGFPTKNEGGNISRAAFQQSFLYESRQDASQAAAPPMTDAAVPEPPTVLFESDTGLSGTKSAIFSFSESGRRASKKNQTQQTTLSPPLPPPPCVFGEEDEGGNERQREGDEELRWPFASTKGARDLSPHEPHLHGNVPPSRRTDKAHVFDGASRVHIKGTNVASYKAIHCSTRSRVDQSVEPHSSSEIPPPPSVFDTPASAPTAFPKHRTRAKPSELDAPRYHHRNATRPELPTLAELLAHLDIEDEMEGKIEDVHRLVYVCEPLPATQIERQPQCHTTGLSFHSGIAFLNETFQESNVSKDLRSRNGRIGKINYDCEPCKGKTTVTGRRRSKGADLQRETPGAVPPLSSPYWKTSLYALLFDNSGTQDGVPHVATRTCAPRKLVAPTPEVRGRRAGGGGGENGGKLFTASTRDDPNELCPCGKARKGQCFLCE